MDASQSDILALLIHGNIEVKGEFLRGYNYTFLVEISHRDKHISAVYKPDKGEQPLWDFPGKTLAHREVAAYIVCEALGWQMVPPTIYRDDGPIGGGSFQQYIEHDPEHHYFKFSKEEIQQLRPVALLDIIINNADRKGGHIIFDSNGLIRLIDHGLCFNAEEKLRTVIWEFSGEPIAEPHTYAIQSLKSQFEQNSILRTTLTQHLHPEEIEATIGRINELLKSGQFPYPPENRRAFPYPPI